MTIAPPGVGVAPKILVVDDDAATRGGLKALFDRVGFTVIAVGTYAEARFALTEEKPDLLILDVRLGEYNGLQLAAVRPPGVPAIVVTAFPDPVLEEEARHLGADYLPKPVVPEALIALVRQKLAGGAHSEDAPRPARRWERKRVARYVPARVGDRSARIVDVSYGGLRLELEPGAEPSEASFTVNLPSIGVSVPVDVVWTIRSDEAWVCGAILAQPDDRTHAAWQGLVDAMA